MRTVFRTEVPIDDEVHELKLTGPIVHVATRSLRTVEVWHLHDDDELAVLMPVRVFGTGKPLSDDAGEHLGTAIVPGGALVWHLFQVAP